MVDEEDTTTRCYLICTVQRTGSWLLCHALEDTGVAGVPAEYFHRGDEALWADRWRTTGDAAFFAAMVSEQRTPNGVFGSKMMWNYFQETLERLRNLAGDRISSDAQVLATRFPELRYLWLRRGDFVRQGVSWWAAAATGQYALIGDERRALLPDPDYDKIANLARLAEESDLAWQEWFATHNVVPLEVRYEAMVGDLEATVLQVLAFLGLEPPDLPLKVIPRLRRQADDATERVVESFLRYGDPRRTAGPPE
jgi:LPS sulfotransferase NodH